MLLSEFTNAPQQNSTCPNAKLLSHCLADCKYFLCEVGFLPHNVWEKEKLPSFDVFHTTFPSYSNVRFDSIGFMMMMMMMMMIMMMMMMIMMMMMMMMMMMGDDDDDDDDHDDDDYDDDDDDDG